MNRKILSAFLTAVVLLGSFSSISLPASGAGNFIITNPYADVNWTTFRQYKAALHTHSTHSNESGMTAAVNGLDVMSERHYSLGFHVVAVTDHSRTTVSPDVVPANISADAIRTPLSTARMNAMAQGAGRGGAEGMIFIPNSNERSHTLPAITTDNHHVGAYFVDSTRSGSMSAFLSDFDTRNGYAVLNHPSRYVGAAWSDTTNKTTVRTIFNRESVWRPYADLYLNHSSLKGLEIVNEFDYDSQGTRILWDNILRQTAPAGKLVWGFANDDAHHVPTIGYTYNLLLMPSLSLDYVRTSMDSGAFLAFGRVDRSRDIYPVATMREQSNNRRDDSAIRRALDMPVPAITSISVGVDTVTVNARVSGANSTYPENASNMTIQ
ncbi:MAG: hypothetical protein FWD35_06085 [Oscillospiraceae bacterium]|nr:hypothetical protein [Oscillospiraceae bacterium]